jgi:hypothetical protein
LLAVDHARVCAKEKLALLIRVPAVLNFILPCPPCLPESRATEIAVCCELPQFLEQNQYDGNIQPANTERASTIRHIEPCCRISAFAVVEVDVQRWIKRVGAG